MQAGYSDLDELCLRVRDPESKRLIYEAVCAYRAGAIRSSIVSSWVAVAFDILSKTRELAAQGEPEPVAHIKMLDTAIESRNLPKLQSIENECLDFADSKLELFSPHELEALRRLKDDRNLCAHPALNLENDIYSPTPELARTHIVHALSYLLTQAPLQGKSAIRRLDSEIRGQTFDTVNAEDLRKYFRERYLKKAKTSLVKQLVTGFLSMVVGNECSIYLPKRGTIIELLKELASFNTAIWDQVGPAFVGQKYEHVPDDRILNIVPFLDVDSRLWSWLSEPVRLLIIARIKSAPFSELISSQAFALRMCTEVFAVALCRFAELSEDEKVEVIKANPRPEFVEESLEIYASAKGFRSAERLGLSLILPLAPVLDAAHLRKVLCSVKSNDQIYLAAKTPEVLAELFAATRHLLDETEEDWRRFVGEMAKKQDDPEDMYAYPVIRALIDLYRA